MQAKFLSFLAKRFFKLECQVYRSGNDFNPSLPRPKFNRDSILIGLYFVITRNSSIATGQLTEEINITFSGHRLFFDISSREQKHENIFFHHSQPVTNGQVQ